MSNMHCNKCATSQDVAISDCKCSCHINKQPEGLKFDGEKIRLDLIPADSIWRVGKVLTFGAKKYGDRNWEKGIHYMRLAGAILRHLYGFVMKEDVDEESGLPHTSHLACTAMMLDALANRKDKQWDNRPNR